MIELTELQSKELSSSGSLVFDPLTREEYVLIRRVDFERLRLSLTDDLNAREIYPAIDRAFAAGWDDPKMDDYDSYEDLKP